MRWIISYAKVVWLRPEIAVLLAYIKIWLYRQLLESKQPDDDFYGIYLE